jgi:hypothetical protein
MNLTDRTEATTLTDVTITHAVKDGVDMKALLASLSAVFVPAFMASSAFRTCAEAVFDELLDES